MFIVHFSLPNGLDVWRPEIPLPSDTSAQGPNPLVAVAKLALETQQEPQAPGLHGLDPTL